MRAEQRREWRREVSRSRSACVWEEQAVMAQKRHPEEEKGNSGAGEKRQKVPDLGRW